MNTPTHATIDATRDTTQDDLSRQAVSLSVAATTLGVSLRTVQRRVKSGELASVEREGMRLVLLDGDTTHGATRDTTARQSVATEPLLVTTKAQNGTGEVESLKDALARERENAAFLRGVIEQLQRDAIELRAIARDALKIAPRQLPAPEKTQLSSMPESSLVEATKSATMAQNGAQNSETGNHSPKVTSGPNSQPDRQESGLSYGDIADWLEKELNQ